GTGPVADLHIINKDLSPDGFQRPTVVAGGGRDVVSIGRAGDNVTIRF
uniref:Laccase-2d (Fragments) n=1 Tax=Cerrena unicolor TaxID=90312 RepID=LAC2D_CERUI|nr:RecName: Full=Laccase-2d; AltName: Full=Benzenediol:oxygen oxidoreductase; AltName: Full=Diphenol oxidase; AltName: Full=Laccase-IId; Short=Lac-IId; AltName: Full=Urishiol oxidase [Cerrena unicolor]